MEETNKRFEAKLLKKAAEIQVMEKKSMTVKPAIKSTDADVIKIITSKPRDEIPIVKKSQVEDYFNKQEEEKLLLIVPKTENKTFLNVFQDESTITEDLTYCSLTKDKIITLGPQAAIQILVIPENDQVKEFNKQEETSLLPSTKEEPVLNVLVDSSNVTEDIISYLSQKLDHFLICIDANCSLLIKNSTGNQEQPLVDNITEETIIICRKKLITV